MTVRNKCRIVFFLSMLAAIPGIAVLASVTQSVWIVGIVIFSFWMSGQLFVLAMIGDGKEGLGIRKEEDETVR